MNSTIYGTNWNGAITGTASDATSGVASVTVAVKDTTTGMWWGGSAFDQSSQTFVPVTTGTTSWSLTFGAGNLTSSHGYSVVAKATDNATNSGTSSTVTFTYNTTAPTVTATVIGQASGAAVNGFIQKNTGYFVYANVTDNSGTGIQCVTANVNNVTTGQTAVSLDRWVVHGARWW